ncbi:hypothetical protein HAX54_047631, partial [Datura stramonium]|nr:hypothetical protein [Datura stramonium]
MGRELVDVELGELKFRVGGEEFTLNVWQPAKPHNECKVNAVLGEDEEQGNDCEEEVDEKDGPLNE